MRRANLVTAGAIAVGLLVPSSSQAQSQGLSGLLLRFFAPSRPVILKDTGHSAHFGSQPSAQATLTQLNRSIASQIATTPVGSSSGGFAYTFDPSLGVFTRTSESFGPLFAERALTLGKGKVAFGTNYSRATFDSFEGLNLRKGDITLYLVHQDINFDGTNLDFFFEGDLIRADLLLKIEAETATMFASYGVTDRLDVGVALPFLRIDIDARIVETIDRLSTIDLPRNAVHIFQGDVDSREEREADTAEGLGDLVIRTKYLLRKTEGTAVAAGLDLRLPTADETELLGSGATQAKLFLIVSGTGPRFSPHLNLGYTFSRGGSVTTGKLPDEINYTVGFDAALTKRLTVNGDIIGRTLRNTDRIVKVEREFQYRHGFEGPIESAVRTDFATQRSDLNVLVGTAGIKLNPFGNLLISANVIASMGKRGLQDYLTPVFAVDYSF
jgi:hypothetical protein